MTSLSYSENKELQDLQNTTNLDPSTTIRKWHLEFKLQLLNQFESGWEMPLCGQKCIQSYGVSLDRAFLYHNSWTYDIPNNFVGMILTEEGRFYEYEIEYSEDLSRVLNYEFSEITTNVNLLCNNKGIPKTQEAVALDTLRSFLT